MLRIVTMGVAGCGKSTTGAALARHLGVSFFEGDTLHSPESRARMAAGQPLTDADRLPWLHRVAAVLQDRAPVVVACSALRRSYRDILRQGAGGPVVFLHITGPQEVLAARLAARTDHFFPASLMDSQLATLEPPDPDETALALRFDQPLAAQVAQAAQWLSARGLS
ncbi:gluconokinase [Neotabrizicola sp. VNH66]|uniref:gluconokinase n=1 Tax=Neotabrizicola sp. VNH66 TaxID=3400918 RepID=UPI003BFDA2C1